MDQLLFLEDVHNTSVAAIGPSEELYIPAKAVQEEGRRKGEEEQVWGISGFHRSSEHGLPVFERVKSLCESVSFPVLFTVVGALRRVEDAICALLII